MQETKRHVFDILQELSTTIRESESASAYALLALGYIVGVAVQSGISASAIAGLISMKAEPTTVVE